MIYNRLQGTTASEFKLGKYGPSIANDGNGQLKIIIPTLDGVSGYEFLVGIEEITGNSNNIPSAQAVISYVNDFVTSVEGNFLNLDLASLQTVSGEITFQSDVTFESDVIVGGEIHGPATMVIDPQTVGDETGTVVIKGDLQIEGTTTTLNSTVVDIVDTNITLAKGSSNSAAADGAGITIDLGGIAGDGQVEFDYSSTTDSMNLNKDLNITGGLTTTGDIDAGGIITSGGERVVTSVSGGGSATGDVVTSASIVDGELVLQTDTYLHTGTSEDNIDQDVYGEKSFKENLNADAGITTTTVDVTVADGTAPMTVTSTTKVDNLNADKVDGADVETTITDSDTKIPTSAAVLTWGVPKNIGAMPSLSFIDARSTTEKDNSFVYVYDDTGASKKMSVSEIHRPSAFIDTEANTTNYKIGDFVYIGEE